MDKHSLCSPIKGRKKKIAQYLSDSLPSKGWEILLIDKPVKVFKQKLIFKYLTIPSVNNGKYFKSVSSA